MKDQVIIVTGGATGIGRGISEVLAGKGARVAIVQPTLEQAKSTGIAGAQGFAADVRDVAQVEAMVAAVLTKMGRVDGLVNNAGVTGRPAVNAFLATPPEQVDLILDVNLKGAIWCSQAVARHWVTSGRAGSIVHIASTGAFVAQDQASVYCASKAALVALSRSMALELAASGIRVNTVAPGDILTAMNADVGIVTAYGRKTPLGRRGSPEDIGHAVAYLLSAEAGFVTGAVLQADGGLLTY